MQPDIFVTNLREVNKGLIRYSCDAFIRSKNQTLSGCSLMEKGQNRWVNFPSQKWEVNGETKYKEMVTFHDPIENQQIRTGIKKGIDELLSPSTEEKNNDIENLPF